MDEYVCRNRLSALAGYWMVTVKMAAVLQLTTSKAGSFTIMAYSLTLVASKNLMVINSRFADVQVGIGMYIRGTDNPLTAWEERKKFSQQNEKAILWQPSTRRTPVPKKVFIEGSLFVDGRRMTDEKGDRACTLAEHPCVHGAATWGWALQSG